MAASEAGTVGIPQGGGAAGRTAEILLALGRYGFGALVDPGLWRRWVGSVQPAWAADEGAEADAVRLRKLFESLGAPFVKIGQLLALRADELPRPYREELSRLFGHTLPLPFEEIEGVLAAELGSDWRRRFRDFDPRPLSSASIGQVHRAALPDGSPVAVKVQRPGVRELFETDFAIVRQLARWSRLHALLGIEADQLSGVLEEVETFTRKELDYTHEARAAARLAALEVEGIEVPRVFGDLSTRRVLTTAFLEGVTVNEVLARRDDGEWLARNHVDRDDLALRIMRAQVWQALGHGFFQADPHPANLIARPDGRLGYVDFGIVGELDETLRQELVDAILCELLDDYEGVWPILLRHAPPTPQTDLRAFKAEYRALSERFKAEAGRTFSGRSLGIYVEEALRLYRRHRLEVASGWATYLRSVIVYGNTVAALSEEVDFMRDTLPIYWELKMRQSWAPVARERWTLVLLRQAFELRHTLRALANVARRAEAGDLTLLHDEPPRLERVRNLRVRAGVLTGLVALATWATVALRGSTPSWLATGAGLGAVAFLLWRLALVLRRLR